MHCTVKLLHMSREASLWLRSWGGGCSHLTDLGGRGAVREFVELVQNEFLHRLGDLDLILRPAGSR